MRLTPSWWRLGADSRRTRSSHGKGQFLGGVQPTEKHWGWLGNHPFQQKIGYIGDKVLGGDLDPPE